MAKYELPQYQSMYRDTGSVQVNQLKRQEYLANMQADNALSTSIMNMDALDEDLEALNLIADKYNDNIDTRSQRGDYENMGMTVAKDAMDFVKDYTPLKKSKQFYDAYKAKLDEAYKKGDITVETRDGRLKQSRDNYKGIQYTASGVIDRDSYFTGKGFVNDVDVNKAIITEFKDVVPREMDLTGFENLVDANFTSVFDEGAGAPVWTIKQGDKTVTIPPNLVRTVVTSVMNRSDVANTIEQEAELETYDNEDPKEAVSKVVSNLKRSITKLKNKTGLSDEEQEINNNEIASLEKYVSSIQELSNAGNNSQALKGIRANEIKDEYMQLAMGKYAYENVKRVRDFTLLDAEGVGAAGLKTVPQVLMLAKSDEALASEVIGGPTKEAKANYIKEQDAVLASILERPQYKEVDGMLDKLYNIGNDEQLEELAGQLGVDASVLLADSNNAKRARDQKDIVNRQLQEALNTVKKTDESNEEYYARISAGFDRRGINLDESVQGELTMLTYNNVRDILEEEGIIPQGSSIYEAMDYITYQDEGVTIGATGYTTGVSVPKVSRAIYDNLINKGVINKGTTDNVAYSEESPFALNNIQQAMRALKDGFLKETKVDRESIEKDLDAAQNKFDGIVDLSFADPTGKNSKAIKDVLNPASLPDDVAVVTGDGERIAFGKYIEEEFGSKSNYKVIKEQSGLVNVASPDGTPLLRLVVQDLGKTGDKTGSSKTVYIPANELLSESTLEFTNSTEFKLQRLWGTGDAGALQSWTPGVFGGTVQFDYTRNEILILDEKSGQMVPRTKEQGMKELSQLFKNSKFIY